MKEDQIFLKKLILYIISSNLYKSKNKKLFLNSINKLEPYLVFKVLSKLQIAGLFYKTILNYKLDKKYIYYITPLINYNKFHSKLLFDEIKLIGKYIKAFNPVLLKGTSFWGDIYKLKYLRNSRDIDIYFSEIPEELDIIMKSLNYHNLYDSKRYDLENHYTRKTYLKRIKIEVSNNLNKLIQFYLNNYNYHGIEILGNNTYVFDVKIEIHKSLLKYKNNNSPILDKNFFRPSKCFCEYQVLKKYINLPYLANKIYFDFEEYYEGHIRYAKSFKLVADFIKILLSVSQKEITESLVISNRIFSLDYYTSLLNSVQSLTPELEFYQLKKSKEDNLETFLDKFLINY